MIRHKFFLYIVAFSVFFSNDLVLADTSGVDPYQTVQAMLSQSSSATRESVIDMTRSIFTKPYATYTPEIYAPGSDDQDLSISYLGQLFGTVPGVLNNSATTILSQMFYVFNMGIFAVVGLVLSMIIVTNTVNTGAQGQFMGRRNQNPYWIWFRSFTGVAILMPSYNGYSFIQVLVIWVAVQGVGLCNAIWSEVQNVVYQTSSILTYVKLVDADANTSVSGNDPLSVAEHKAYDRCLYSVEKGCQSSGKFLANSSVKNSVNLTQMLLMYQACLSFNLQKLERDYEACMKVAGNYDGISCYPPRREDLYTLNYSTYQLSYVGPSGSSDTYACGNITMTPKCSDKSKCSDYQLNYDQQVFAEFVQLLTASIKPADDIFKYYDNCNEDDPSTSCYQPPANETSKNCIDPSSSEVSSNCDITRTSMNAMNTLVEKVIGYQSNYADDVVVTDMNNSASETGLTDPVGFMSGGWIIAGNSYGTMVYYGPTDQVSSLPNLNDFKSTMQTTSLPDSLSLTLGYISPNSGIISSMGGTDDGSGLSADATLQQSFLDWSNAVGDDEIADARKQIEDAPSSSSGDTITGYPIYACLTGDYYYKNGQTLACSDVLGGEAASSPSSGSLDEFGCGKNDYSVRYLTCIATNKLSNGSTSLFPFNVNTDDNQVWTNYLTPTYDIAWDLSSISSKLTPPNWEQYVTTYFSNIQLAWLTATFGGDDVRSIVDPINRMRMMGINLIQYSTDYVQDIITNVLEFVQNVVWSMYFSYLISQISIVASMTILTYLTASVIGNAITYTEEILIPALLASVFGAVLVPFVLIALGILMILFAVFNVIAYGVGVVFDVLAQLIPLMAQMFILSATQFFGVYLAIAIPIFLLGGYLAGYLSMLPYLVFLVTVAGWFLLILESTVAAPLIALGITYPQGHDFFGRAEQLMSMFLSIFVRPAGILIGFIFGIMMASLSLFLMNAIFFPVIVNYVGLLFNSDFLSIQLTNYLQNGGTSPYANFSGGLVETFIYFLLMIIYTYTASNVIVQSFSLTYMIPYQLTKWVDPRAAESTEEVRGAMDEIKQSFVGEVIAGLANAVTSLFALTSMFAQVAQVSPSGTGQFRIGQPTSNVAKPSNDNANVS